MIDSHTHLDACQPDNDELIAAARAAGITKIVNVGLGSDGARSAIATAERYPEVYAALAIHPNDAQGFVDSDLDAIRELARHPRCVAIGETGLDYFRDHADPADQKRAFVAHIELAREVGKPVMIHTRAADDDTIKLLDEQASDLTVILHCFSMGERIDECLAHERWWCSFAGNVTYPKNEGLRAAALKVPAGRLLVETDAPYLAPQPVRGKPNSTANVVLTAEALALTRRVGYDELERQLHASAAAVFEW